MSWLSVAAYSFTGTLTRPKDTAPFQMARMGSSDRESVVSSPIMAHPATKVQVTRPGGFDGAQLRGRGLPHASPSRLLVPCAVPDVMCGDGQVRQVQALERP